MWLFKPFELLIKYRNMLLQTTSNEIKARYAGSFLGLTWAVLYPLLFLGCYAAVFVFVYNVRFDIFNTNDYIALIFCGLIPFLGFAEALQSGISSVTSNVNLMKNTLFPIELVPVKTLFAGQTTQAAGLGLLLIALAFLGKLSLWTPFFIVLWILQIMFSLGVVWILSSVNVVVRDLQNMISVIVLLLMMISPIAYPVEMVPENLRPFLAANPLYYIISTYQDVLMFGRFPRLEVFLPFVILSFVTFILGYWFFTKMKRVFADNV